jgi:hypothetical protein
MPDTFYADLISQIPLVAVIVWFVFAWTKRSEDAAAVRNKEFQEFIEVQNAALREALAVQSKQLGDLTKMLDSHDRITEAALVQMFERSGGTLKKRRSNVDASPTA